MQPLIVLTARVCKRQPPMPSWSAQAHTVRQTFLAKAAEATEGHPLRGAWAAIKHATQRGHLPSFPWRFNSASGVTPQGPSARARPSALDKGPCTGHVALRGALTAEVKARPDAKKARDARAKARGAQGAAPARRRPQGGVPPRPLPCGRGRGAARPGLDRRPAGADVS